MVQRHWREIHRNRAGLYPPAKTGSTIGKKSKTTGVLLLYRSLSWFFSVDVLGSLFSGSAPFAFGSLASCLLGFFLVVGGSEAETRAQHARQQSATARDPAS
jgi:hypothetical protein